jgi:chemotaxis protein MotB
MARKKKKAGKENSERWLLTYSDLITLLMVFFVLLYSMSKTDVAKFQQLAASLHSALGSGVLQQSSQISINDSTTSANSLVDQSIFDHIKQSVSQATKQNGIDPSLINIQTTPEGISISISGMLLFYNGTDEIKPDGITLLQTIGANIQPIPNNVRIEGHTDDIAPQNSPYATNWELSAARAVAVVRFLTDQIHVTPSRLSAVGYGQYHPIVPNDTREHRETNRRAVIVILNTTTITGGNGTPTP